MINVTHQIKNQINAQMGNQLITCKEKFGEKPYDEIIVIVDDQVNETGYQIESTIENNSVNNILD